MTTRGRRAPSWGKLLFDNIFGLFSLSPLSLVSFSFFPFVSFFACLCCGFSTSRVALLLRLLPFRPPARPSASASRRRHLTTGAVATLRHRGGGPLAPATVMGVRGDTPAGGSARHAAPRPTAPVPLPARVPPAAGRHRWRSRAAHAHRHAPPGRGGGRGSFRVGRRSRPQPPQRPGGRPPPSPHTARAPGGRVMAAAAGLSPPAPAARAHARGDSGCGTTRGGVAGRGGRATREGRHPR